MKRISLLLSILMLGIVVSANAAGSVTQAIFSITSSAVTSTSNLRVQPMSKIMARDSFTETPVQSFARSATTTQNLFLTKNTPVDLTTALCLYIEVDQNTKMYLNSETSYILIPSGTRETQCFK